MMFSFFCQDHPDLWDHSQPAYHNRDTTAAAISEIQSLLLEKKSKEAITRKFASLRTSYIRERKRKKGSKTSGSGSDDIYVSHWKYYKEMDFLRDEIEGEESVDNINLKLQNNLKKRKKSRDPEEETKAELWQSALNALKAPESQLNVCSHVMDPDEQWLLSLSTQLKSLTAQQKSLAKLKIQTLLHELVFSSTSDIMFRYFIIMKI